METKNSLPELVAALKSPLKKRGRPKIRRLNPPLQKRRHKHSSRTAQHQQSNLAFLLYNKKISVDQFNYGENFLWIIRKAKKTILCPRMAQNRYCERIQAGFGNFMDEVDQEKNIEEQRKILCLWKESMTILKEMGCTTKKVLENFLYHEQPAAHQLSETELHLIRRGLDMLGHLYKQR